MDATSTFRSTSPGPGSGRAQPCTRISSAPCRIAAFIVDVGMPIASGNLDDARLDWLEALGNLRVVARDDELRGYCQAIDRLEGREHLGQARDDLHGLACLDVVIEVRRIRREHDGA